VTQATLSQTAAKFCAFHNANLTKSQMTMIEDGLPRAAIMSDEDRRAARNLSDAVTTMPRETVPPLYPPETEDMKKTTKRLKALTSKKNIHVPKKPAKKPAVVKTKNVKVVQAKASAAAARSPVAPKTPKPISRPANPQTRVSGQDIGNATCVAGGVSMADLVKTFGIEAHPMRAKIHYAKHKLGYAIENRDGRYYGTAPKVSA